MTFTKFLAKGLSFMNVMHSKHSKLSVIQMIRVEEISAKITHILASIFGKKFTKYITGFIHIFRNIFP